MSTISAERLATTLVEVADTLVDDFDLIEFLHMLTDRAADLVSTAGVSLLLADRYGKLECLAGSNENVKVVELFQLQTQQGPCLEAFRTGQPVISTDLNAAGPRWPQFAPRAAATGFGSVHAFPLRLRSQMIGVMNVFGGTRGGHLGDTDVSIMQSLADVAAIGLLQERTIRRGETLTGQLQSLLDSRIVIEQAKGAVAQYEGIDVDEAFTVIRTYARRHNQKLTDVAHALVNDSTALARILYT